MAHFLGNEKNASYFLKKQPLALQCIVSQHSIIRTFSSTLPYTGDVATYVDIALVEVTSCSMRRNAANLFLEKTVSAHAWFTLVDLVLLRPIFNYKTIYIRAM